MGNQLNIPPGTNVFTNPAFNNLFTSINMNQSSIIGKGSLISFNYTFWKHDPYPLVMLTDYQPGMRVRGVNLNYLTFNIMKNMLSAYGENRGFSYSNIKFDKYIVGAFRTYKWNGVRGVRRLDSKYLASLVSITRSFDRTNLDAIKKIIQEQLNKQVNPKAEPTKLPENQQPGQQPGDQLIQNEILPKGE